jgi:hypothetical protein
MSPIRLEDNNLTALANMPFHPASENLPKIQFGEVVCSEWRENRVKKKFFGDEQETKQNPGPRASEPGLAGSVTRQKRPVTSSGE